jgi:hypothetical protein
MGGSCAGSPSSAYWPKAHPTFPRRREILGRPFSHG